MVDFSSDPSFADFADFAQLGDVNPPSVDPVDFGFLNDLANRSANRAGTQIAGMVNAALAPAPHRPPEFTRLLPAGAAHQAAPSGGQTNALLSPFPAVDPQLSDAVNELIANAGSAAVRFDNTGSIVDPGRPRVTREPSGPGATPAGVAVAQRTPDQPLPPRLDLSGETAGDRFAGSPARSILDFLIPGSGLMRLIGAIPDPRNRPEIQRDNFTTAQLGPATADAAANAVPQAPTPHNALLRTASSRGGFPSRGGFTDPAFNFGGLSPLWRNYLANLSASVGGGRAGGAILPADSGAIGTGRAGQTSNTSMLADVFRVPGGWVDRSGRFTPDPAVAA